MDDPKGERNVPVHVAWCGGTDQGKLRHKTSVKMTHTVGTFSERNSRYPASPAIFGKSQSNAISYAIKLTSRNERQANPIMYQSTKVPKRLLVVTN